MEGILTEELSSWPEVKAWRKIAREKILAARVAIPEPVRKHWTGALIERLRPALREAAQPISFYWPIKGEPDFRPLMREFDADGVKLALPVAVRLGEPLRFRPWHHRCEMERGLWNIPIPATKEEIEPRTLLAPIVGYDRDSYRLGYGGGFFDRTLALYGPNVRAIGVGFSIFQLPTIHVQPHDVRLSRVLTEITSLEPAAQSTSPVCYLEESSELYAGYLDRNEIAGELGNLLALLPPERRPMIDYIRWRLDLPDEPPTADATTNLKSHLDRLLPRIPEDWLHRALSCLR